MKQAFQCRPLSYFLAAVVFTVAGNNTLRAESNAPDKFPAESIEFFEKHIRPVLVENCYSCHGAKLQQSGLRVDSRTSIVKGGESGPAVVPGKPKESIILEAVKHTSFNMPPDKKLPEDQVKALERWIEMGAPWPVEHGTPEPGLGDQKALSEKSKSHWAFQPIGLPAVPKVVNTAWVKNPIDAFILAKLEEAGLKPSAAADRRTLIRRVTFDLIGLPPTRQEVDSFLADQSPEAFAKLVDRLLASPQYGERWGRYWLDVARYADTKGYVFTEERRYPYSYTYRDWVIDAFNRDLPYDKFLLAQIAGDKVFTDPKDTRELAGMGFLTVGRRFLNNGHDIIDDRIDVVTRGVLGLSVTCARCHDHKFDAIAAKDYYSLHGIFNSSHEPGDLPVLPAKRNAEQEKQYADYEKQRSDRQKVVDDYLGKSLNEFNNEARVRFADLAVAHQTIRSKKGQLDFDALAREKNLRVPLVRYIHGKLQTYVTRKECATDPILMPWSSLVNAPADRFAVHKADLEKKLAGKHNVNPLVVEILKKNPPNNANEVVDRYAELFRRAEDEWQKLQKDAAVPAEKKARLADESLEAIRQLAYGLNSPLLVPIADVEKVFDRSHRDHLVKIRSEVITLGVTHPGAPPRAMVMNDNANVGDSKIFQRGDPGRQGEIAPRRFLPVISRPDAQPFKQGSGRLELAQAIVGGDNPLTARVMANRIWMNHFGGAFVRTPSDFGLRTEAPTHPELLDYLARTFIDNGWSVKKLHRHILLSSVYQQKSEDVPASLAKDPENRLFWKFNRRRLDFEAMRDSILAASGQLDQTMGGSAVSLMTIPATRRRTVYGYIDRLNLDSIFRTFDLPSPDVSSPKRYETTVPQQALYALNNPFVIAEARALATLPEVTQQGDPAARVQSLYQRLFSRAADADEVAIAKEFIAAAPSIAAEAMSVWQYGYGSVEPAATPAEKFIPLPHWNGKAYQGGPKMPDPKLTWVGWNEVGGHPGDNKKVCAIRRWTAPMDGSIFIGGGLKHPDKNGDGVHGAIVASRGGKLKEWDVKEKRADTKIDEYKVQKGETIDFIVDCRAESSYDSFEWPVTIRWKVDPKKMPNVTTNWNSKEDFEGPRPVPLAPWERYAHALMLTNEFVFID